MGVMSMGCGGRVFVFSLPVADFHDLVTGVFVYYESSKHLMTKLLAILKYFSIFYISVLFVVFIALFFISNEVLENGCYLRNALLIGVRCVGFDGAAILSAILNLPFYLFSTPIILLMTIGTPELFIRAFLMSIIIWTPIVFLLSKLIRYLLKSSRRE